MSDYCPHVRVRVPADSWSCEPSPHRFDACLTVIEQQIKECRGKVEYPLYVKALIKRRTRTPHATRHSRVRQRIDPLVEAHVT